MNLYSKGQEINFNRKKVHTCKESYIEKNSKYIYLNFFF